MRQGSQPAVFLGTRHGCSRWIRTGRDHRCIELFKHYHDNRLRRDPYSHTLRRSQATGQRTFGRQYQSHRTGPEPLRQRCGVVRYPDPPATEIIEMTEKRRKRMVAGSPFEPTNRRNRGIRRGQCAKGILRLRWHDGQIIAAETIHEGMHDGPAGSGTLDWNDRKPIHYFGVADTCSRTTQAASYPIARRRRASLSAASCVGSGPASSL